MVPTGDKVFFIMRKKDYMPLLHDSRVCFSKNNISKKKKLESKPGYTEKSSNSH